LLLAGISEGMAMGSFVASDVGSAAAEALDFDVLYRVHWWPLLKLAHGLVDDVAAAEDIVQDAFIGLYRKQTSLRDLSAAPGYLRTSVVNGARSALRRRRTARVWGAFNVGSTPAADESAVASSDYDAARHALMALPRRQREVLTLRFVSDLSDVEIAEALGTSPANVRSAASRGMTAIRHTMKGSA
jgi:RNA polymerase sigma factor (sigma-70 family)